MMPNLDTFSHILSKFKRVVSHPHF